MNYVEYQCNFNIPRVGCQETIKKADRRLVICFLLGLEATQQNNIKNAKGDTAFLEIIISYNYAFFNINKNAFRPKEEKLPKLFILPPTGLEEGHTYFQKHVVSCAEVQYSQSKIWGAK